MMQFLKKHPRFFSGIYVLVTLVITLVFLRRQINSSYLDFSEGNYLYLSSIYFKGIPYRDFLVPHPPVLFIIGSVLTGILRSVYAIRFFNLFVYVAGGLLFYNLAKKLLKNNWLTLLAGVIYYIMPLSAIWWMTFTMETMMRPLILILLNLLLPMEKLDRRKLIFISLLSIIMVFLKYSALPVVAAVAIVLLIYKRNLFYLYIGILAPVFLVAVFVLQKLTGNMFLEQTVFIRSIIPQKDRVSEYFASVYYLVEFIPFILLNAIFSLYSFIKKNYSEFAVSFISVSFFLVFFVTLNLGTYNYIYFPIEPVVLLAGFLFINRKTALKTGLLRLLGSIVLFFCGLIVVYAIQIFPFKINYIANPIDRSSTSKAVELVKKFSTPKDKIIGPPFFAYASGRRVDREMSDIFMWAVISNHGQPKEWQKRVLDKIAEDIKLGRVSVILADVHIQSMDPIMNNIGLRYRKVASLEFVSNRGQIDVYVKN